MRNDFEYIEKNEANKAGLASIAKHPLYRLRRLELVGYSSLAVNIVAVLCILAMIIFGR